MDMATEFQQWKSQRQQPQQPDLSSEYSAWKAKRQSVPTPEPEYSPNDGMGIGEKLLVGAGRGFTDAYEGVKQLGLEAGQSLGLVPPETLAESNRRASEEKALYERHAGDDTAMSIGRFAGQNLPYAAIPGSAASAAGRVAAGSGIGAVAGATQFVEEGESRADNAMLGAALGGAASGVLEGVGRAAGKLINARKGNIPDEAREVLETGKRHGVEVFADDLSANPTLNRLSVASEQVPIVGMTGPRQAQQEAAKAAALRYQGNLGDDIDVGRTLQASLSRRTQALERASRSRYEKLSRAADPLGNVPTKRTQATATRLLGQAQARAPEYQDAGLIKTLEKYRTDPQANFSTLHSIRSDLMDDIRLLERQGDKKAARPLKALLGGINADIRVFAKSHGGNVERLWREADDFHRTRVVPQRQKDIQNAANSTEPDQIYRRFIKTGLADKPQRLYDALDSKGRKAVKFGMISEALENSIAENFAGAPFSPARFAGHLERIEKATGVFFKGADKRELDGLTRLMRHIQRAGQVAERPPNGMRVLPFALGGASVLRPDMAAGAVAGTAGLRWLLTSDLGKRLLLASSRYQPGSTSMQKIINRIEKLAPAAAANEVTQ